MFNHVLSNGKDLSMKACGDFSVLGECAGLVIFDIVKYALIISFLILIIKVSITIISSFGNGLMRVIFSIILGIIVIALMWFLPQFITVITSGMFGEFM